MGALLVLAVGSTVSTGVAAQVVAPPVGEPPLAQQAASGPSQLPSRSGAPAVSGPLVPDALAPAAPNTGTDGPPILAPYSLAMSSDGPGKVSQPSYASLGGAYRPLARRPGLTLGVGFGQGYGGFGAQAAYQLPLEFLQLSVFVGLGVMPGLEQANAPVGLAGGLQLALGNSNRLLVELGVAPGTYDRWQLHGTVVKLDINYGPYAIAAYEYLWERGLFVRFGVGAQVTPGERVVAGVVLTMGAGWKF